MARTCEKCNTPLDDEGNCVTCEAEAEGLKLLSRSGYASVREMNNALEAAGLSPEMEQVPAGRPEERAHPLWNLYAETAEVERAVAVLRQHWAELLGDPAAAAAAQRGIAVAFERPDGARPARVRLDRLGGVGRHFVSPALVTHRATPVSAPRAGAPRPGPARGPACPRRDGRRSGRRPAPSRRR